MPPNGMQRGEVIEEFAGVFCCLDWQPQKAT